MRNIAVSIVILLVVSMLYAPLYAQAPATADSSIVTYLTKQTEGKVTITQDPRLTERIGRYGVGKNIEENGAQAFLVTQGYRIQVFSGNNQRLSRGEALDKERQIREWRPELETYITFTSPFWKLRAGNFTSYEVAFALLREMKTFFPRMGKEMYIVKDEVRIPITPNKR